MDITSSQKRSTPNSATTNKDAKTAVPPEGRRPPYADQDEPYDRSFDMVERIRLAREAAERKMDRFSGNLDDYVLVRKIVGQKSIREQQRELEEQGRSAQTGAGDPQLSLDLDKELGEGAL